MSPEEYMDKRALLLKQLNRCKKDDDRSRIQSKIEKLDSTFENGFFRRDVGRPEVKLQEYGVV